MIISVEFLGSLAGICTTFAFLPQVIKVIKTRSVNDISISMYIIFCSGLALWIIYGIYLKSMPLILANVMTLVLASAILTMKALWSNKRLH
jgi:MtN3 and saliva related transmembrane protein